ncbi:hypothetical protein BGW37DRAFT_495795 [Umbelopsis sp. PMI_123]|nr:hypothetical protein BGW37DRAFT_495795 [Umbelopsis sp. PMI_123]
MANIRHDNDLNTEDRRRNKPCENCRAHRRKCVVLSGDRCERCIKNNISCIFLITTKPKVVQKKSISQSKKRRLLNQVWDLEDVCDNLEDQLKSMDIHFDAKKYSPPVKLEQLDEDDESTVSTSKQSNTAASSETEMYSYPKSSSSSSSTELCNCAEPTPCSHMKVVSPISSEWSLTISRGKQGLRFQSSIKTIEDIMVFTAETLKYFSISSDVPRQPMYYSERREGQLQVTLKRLDAEEMVAQLIKYSRRGQHTPINIESIRPILQQAYHSAITHKLLQAYFKCDNLRYALVHEKRYYQHIETHRDCMMVPAMCAYVMASQCQHVMMEGIPETMRMNLELYFASKARSALEEVLFAESPTLESVWTILNLARYNLMILNGSEAWIQIGIAWRMAVQLKSDYLEVLNNPENHTREMQLTADSWRRIYYYIRYMEVNLHNIFQPTSDYLSVIDDCDLGEPTMNDHDLQDDDHKNAFVVLDRLIKLSVRHLKDSNDNILYALFRGATDSVSQSSVDKLEHFLCLWWKELPPQFQLGPSPLQYIPQKTIDDCQIPQVLMLNNLYHLFWMGFQCRLMRDPRHANLASTTLHFSNSDRSLAIVSICCDAIARCNEALLRLSPCKVDAHYLIIAMDVMSRLQTSVDKKISALAKSNLELTMRILKCFTETLSRKGSNFLGGALCKDMEDDDTQTDNPMVGLGQFLERLGIVYENSTPCT